MDKQVHRGASLLKLRFLRTQIEDEMLQKDQDIILYFPGDMGRPTTGSLSKTIRYYCFIFLSNS